MFLVTFADSRVSTYRHAVRLARQGRDYDEIAEERRRFHRAAFEPTVSELTTLAELWELVRTWKSSRLVVRGTPVLGQARRTFGELLQCMVRAALFIETARHCASGAESSGRWPGRPVFPCRWLLARRPAQLDYQVQWADLRRREDQVRALMLEQGIHLCPFLQLEEWERALEHWRPSGPVTLSPIAALDVPIPPVSRERGPDAPSFNDDALWRWLGPSNGEHHH